MKLPERGEIDREIVAYNIMSVRRSQGLTQVQLAAKANVSVPSVFRAEKAKAVRLSTLKMIARGLDLSFDTMFIKTKRGEQIAIHRASDAIWNAEIDRRSRVPDDHLLQYQDENERLRLGRLGFVPSFMLPPTSIMKDGPGLVLIELYGVVEGPFNAHFYKDAVVFVVRGKAQVEIGTQIVEVSEADWVGFQTVDHVAFRPVEPAGPQQFPALLLWIGANRVSKTSKRQPTKPTKP